VAWDSGLYIAFCSMGTCLKVPEGRGQVAQDRLPPGGLARLGTPVQELSHLLHEEAAQQHRGFRRVHLTSDTNDNCQNNNQNQCCGYVNITFGSGSAEP
jgi:hypothetical protein